MKRAALFVAIFCFAQAPLYAQKPSSKGSTGPSGPAPLGSTAPKYGANHEIKAHRLRAHLEFIADDLLEGRNTPSRGLDIAANYIAAQLKLWGIEPGGDKGSYFQAVSTTVPKLDSANTSLRVGPVVLKAEKDFDAYLPAAVVSGSVEYVGYGFRAPSKGIDPYAGRNVKDKILLAISGLPKDIRAEELYGGKIPDAEDPTTAATRLGARAILIIRPETGGATLSIGGQVPNILLKDSGVEAILSGSGLSLSEMKRRIREQDPGDSVSVVPSRSVELTIAGTQETLTYRNVVGIVRGSDPKLKDEYVAFGAHYDHVGTYGDGPGDTIWNGADDDGSGTVAVLEIAHAFGVGPRPKRSLLFVWHAGEEKGLWGSAHFVAHPIVPIDKIVTQLNIDMVGRSKAPGDTKPENKDLADGNSIYVIGSRMLSDDLGNTVSSVNKDLLSLRLDYKYDDPKDPEQFYYRSDHYNYALKGIPIAFFFNGVHEDYHRPSDEVWKIDFQRMEKVGRTIYAIGWQIANNPARPRLNKPNK